MGKVIGPGSLNVDMTGYTPHLPVAGETVKGTVFRMGLGGKGNNQMTAAARAGADAVIIARTGNDSLGGMFSEHFKKEGMTEEYVTVTDTPTGVALIEVETQNAQNRIIILPGANGEVCREDVFAAEKEFAEGGVVLFQYETGAESLLAAKELAKKYGRTVVVNPAPFCEMPDGFYDGIDYITPNETEAEYLSGVHIGNFDDARKAAEIILGMGIGHVIVTMGSHGAYYYDGKEEYRVPCLPVRAVDTTGAGDAFNGAFAAAISDGMDTLTALRFATCCSGIEVTREGAADASPYRNEIIDAMRTYFGINIAE